MKKQLNVLISGGGTGGHIFPALSIANGIKERRPDANILFVGAENRMEMEKKCRRQATKLLVCPSAVSTASICCATSKSLPGC